MKAIKGNKVYIVDEKTKDSYVKAGFDILNDEGKVVENGAGKKVDFSEYAKVLSENKKLKAENEALKIAAMKVDQLKAYAEGKNIDLGDATTKDEILAKIQGK